jgi:hypothetical protein
LFLSKTTVSVQFSANRSRYARHQRRTAPCSILACVKAIGAQRVRDHWHEYCAVAVAVATYALAVAGFESGGYGGVRDGN